MCVGGGGGGGVGGGGVHAILKVVGVATGRPGPLPLSRHALNHFLD